LALLLLHEGWGMSVAQKQMCQICGRGILHGFFGVVYLADNDRIGYNGPAV